MIKPVFHFVLQRTKWDCGIATLASFLCQPYEEVLRVAAAEVKDLREGLTGKEQIAIADHFGMKLRRRVRNIDLEEREGILGFKHKGGGHSVVLANGLIFDPEEKGAVWDADDYVKEWKKLTVADLLEED